MNQPITWTEFLKAVSGAMWVLIKSANWRSFEPLPATVEMKYRVVYWAAWHWGDLMKLYAEMQKASQGTYFSRDPNSMFARKVDKDTGLPVPGQTGTEFNPTNKPTLDGQPTKQAQDVKYWLDYRMPGFPTDGSP